MQPVYELTLHPTYYSKGFFNLGVSVDRHVRSDDGPIVILLGHSGRYIEGTVNRKANLNGTPRVFAGAALRDWFFENFAQGETINAVIEGPSTIRLVKT